MVNGGTKARDERTKTCEIRREEAWIMKLGMEIQVGKDGGDGESMVGLWGKWVRIQVRHRVERGDDECVSGSFECKV